MPDAIAELVRQAEGGAGAAASLMGDHYRAGDGIAQDY